MDEKERFIQRAVRSVLIPRAALGKIEAGGMEVKETRKLIRNVRTSRIWTDEGETNERDYFKDGAAVYDLLRYSFLRTKTG